MPVHVEERIVSGGEGEPPIVHHLVLRGTNRALGRHLGELARTRHRVPLAASADPLRTRVQRAWLRRNAPVLFERLRGACDAFGVDVDDDAYDLGRLGGPPHTAGRAAVFVPGRAAAGGHPLVSRVVDLAARDRPGPDRGEAAVGPYLLELHPDAGHPSLALVAFDLLGAVLDGINAEGLTVAAATDLEATAGPLEPDPAAAGLDELQLGRALLDGCATAIEARELLLAARHHYAALPAHWLVADRHGDAFAFELGPGRNRVQLVEAAGLPLVMTGHPLHRHPEVADLPHEAGPGATYARFRALQAALAEAREPWTAAGLAAAAARAFAVGDGPGRALWHGAYDLRERALEVTFPLDAPGAPPASLRLRLAA